MSSKPSYRGTILAGLINKYRSNNSYTFFFSDETIHNIGHLIALKWNEDCNASTFNIYARSWNMFGTLEWDMDLFGIGVG